MVTVNKDALVRDVAEGNGLPIKTAKDVIDAFLGRISAHAEGGATVRLTGFGSFSVKARPPRTGRNPATGAPIEIAETRRLVFKASKTS